MTFSLRAAALFLSATALLPQTHAASAVSLCDLVKRETVVGLFGRVVTTDVTPNACVFTTKYEGADAFFHVMQHEESVPESGYRQLIISTGPGDEIVDAPGIGEKAIINKNTSDMVVRARGKVYSLSTRGMPCERKKWSDPGYAKEAEECKVKRIDALKLLGAQIAR